MIMLIGLPASGKTTWASKHVEENLEKRYNVIGTSTLVDRMKVIFIETAFENFNWTYLSTMTSIYGISLSNHKANTSVEINLIK